MEFRLDIPKNWQDFETLCQKLWREIWSDPNAQKNGRSGQPQCGVDIFGKPSYGSIIAGVQCKDKDSSLGSELKSAELSRECKKAIKFKPGLSSFTIATTAPRDKSLQEHARKLTASGKYPFDIHVWSWHEIEEEIRFRPNVRNAYYPNVEIQPGEATTVKMSRFSARDQFYAFFSRPDVSALIAPRLGDFLIRLAYELSDNAYLHGNASQFKITCADRTVIFEDDGVNFDPTVSLDSSKTSARSHVGSYVYASFVQEFKDKVAIRHESVQHERKNTNRLALTFNDGLASFGNVDTHNVTVKLAWAYGRKGAERLAASIAIPSGTQELIVSIDDVWNLSGFAEFVRAMLRRLPNDVQLTISLPRDPMLEKIHEWFDDPRLRIKLR